MYNGLGQTVTLSALDQSGNSGTTDETTTDTVSSNLFFALTHSAFRTWINPKKFCLQLSRPRCYPERIP